ncbi:hypothetical protein M378DRAFT_19579 [Amanita muscaria Koide BX008]|uniref:Uncharacterized protein n=1 Tax=Amanita muscaria (strain Koide BX008) TaxID=946122 RepID=A0A0C2WCK4_AMAMK|nr:hypothetical protein M378DRAFT_19579 [Amanita muscaria Koide BX008]
MSPSKRRNQDDSAPCKKAKIPVLLRAARDPKKATIRATSLHMTSGGRIRKKRVKDEKELNIQPNESNAVNGPCAVISDMETDAGATEKPKKQKRTNTTSSKLNEWLEFRDSSLLEIIRFSGLDSLHRLLSTLPSSMPELHDRKPPRKSIASDRGTAPMFS